MERAKKSALPTLLKPRGSPCRNEGCLLSISAPAAGRPGAPPIHRALGGGHTQRSLESCSTANPLARADLLAERLSAVAEPRWLRAVDLALGAVLFPTPRPANPVADPRNARFRHIQVNSSGFGRSLLRPRGDRQQEPSARRSTRPSGSLCCSPQASQCVTFAMTESWRLVFSTGGGAAIDSNGLRARRSARPNWSLCCSPHASRRVISAVPGLGSELG